MNGLTLSGMSGLSMTPLHEHHELRHDTFYRVGDEHLVAVELDASLSVDVDVALYLPGNRVYLSA